MRARITFAFVAILAIALVLSGGVSLLLVRHAVSLSAQRTVLRQAEAVQSAINSPEGTFVSTQAGLRLVESLADVNSVPFVVLSNGKISPTPSPGSLEDDIRGIDLVHGHATSGVHDHIAYAAVPLTSVRGETVAIVFESKESFSSDSIWFFLLASGLSLLGAAALAALISTRVARRVTAVADTSQRIAAGDLSARVAVGDVYYPELLRLDEAINTMAANLESARAGEQDFLLSISHDLRTPLTSIRGYAEAIADGAVADLPSAANVVVSEAARLDRLIGDLLDLARLRAKQFSLDVQPVDLGDVVRLGTAAFRYAFDAAGVELVAPRGGSLTVEADPHRVGQVVANLVENALKFAVHRVQVEIASDEHTATVSVTDDGPGIEAEDLPKVFERLYTSTRNVARTVGTGLGLAIVLELTETMGGEVHVESPVGESGGTRFSVQLPLVHEPAKHQSDGESRSSSGHRTDSGNRSDTVRPAR